MTPGDIVLVPVPQAGGGAAKLRPALLLAKLPGPYQNLLICGVSTQLHAIVQDWDDTISNSDPDFKSSGLRRASAIRLSYLYAATMTEVLGSIGRIDRARLGPAAGETDRRTAAVAVAHELDRVPIPPASGSAAPSADIRNKIAAMWR